MSSVTQVGGRTTSRLIKRAGKLKEESGIQPSRQTSRASARSPPRHDLRKEHVRRTARQVATIALDGSKRHLRFEGRRVIPPRSSRQSGTGGSAPAQTFSNNPFNFGGTFSRTAVSPQEPTFGPAPRRRGRVTAYVPRRSERVVFSRSRSCQELRLPGFFPVFYWREPRLQ